jgi:hypothetical protein
MPNQWFRYVVHAQIGSYLSKGWTIADDLAGTSHGAWSVLMKWTGEGEPG